MFSAVVAKTLQSSLMITIQRLLFVLLVLTMPVGAQETSDLQSEAKPLPPMLDPGSAAPQPRPEPEPALSGSCKVLFGPWTHDSETEGVAQPVDRAWNKSTFPSSPTGGTTWQIASANPIIPGKKYFQTTLNKNNEGHKRTERRLVFEPSSSEVVKHGDDWSASKAYWYAFLLRVDEAPSHGPRGFLMQWHAPNNVATGSASPHHGLRGANGGLAVYMKSRENGADQSSYRNVYSKNILDWPEMKGKAVAVAFLVKWDGRKKSDGSQGIFRVYLNDKSEPVYRFDGDRNLTYGVKESKGDVRFPYLKYGGYDVGSNTGIYKQSYTNLAVLSQGCSHADVLKAIDFKSVAN